MVNTKNKPSQSRPSGPPGLKLWPIHRSITALRRGEGRDAIEAIGCAAGGGVAAVARVRPDADEFGVGVLQGEISD
jgi:hypothetical protein